jgi:hypothetical protein
MKFLFALSSLAVLVFASFSSGQGIPTGVPMRPGDRQAQQADSEADRNLPLPAVRVAHDPAELQREAKELADLAAGIPSAVENARRGLMAKDTLDKLKRMEKLSKRMREQLSRSSTVR